VGEEERNFGKWKSITWFGADLDFPSNMETSCSIARVSIASITFESKDHREVQERSLSPLKFQIPPFAGDVHHFAQAQVFFTFQQGGKIAVNTDIKGLNVEPYETTLDYVRGALEGLLVLGIAYGIFSELRDALRVRKETGSILKYFSSLWNFIDVLSLALLVYAVIHRRVDRLHLLWKDLLCLSYHLMASHLGTAHDDLSYLILFPTYICLGVIARA
jgi:hypothetical protein